MLIGKCGDSNKYLLQETVHVPENLGWYILTTKHGACVLWKGTYHNIRVAVLLWGESRWVNFWSNPIPNFQKSRYTGVMKNVYELLHGRI